MRRLDYQGIISIRCRGSIGAGSVTYSLLTRESEFAADLVEGHGGGCAGLDGGAEACVVNRDVLESWGFCCAGDPWMSLKKS